MADAITKNLQNEEDIFRICQSAFGEAKVPVHIRELTDGFCNAAYDITLNDGRSAILKVAPLSDVKMMSCEVELMAAEVGAMKLAARSGIKGVPKVYFYDDSREICNSAYFLMEKLDGVSYASVREHLSESEAAWINFQTGEYLRSLHEIKGRQFGHFCRKELQRENWFDAFELLLGRIVKDGMDAHIEIGVPYEDIQDLLVKHKAYFEEVREASLLHWDSWDGNIFVKDGKLVGLIDWERSMWGDPLMEDRFRFHTVNQDFLKGYGYRDSQGDVVELSHAEQIRCKWYDVYLYLIMMFEVFYRQYATQDQYEWVKGMFLPIWEELRQETVGDAGKEV
ncbi:MAG: aminoglycoside phosphotransferase family protein [Lachnospiraceae bacterium]|nr:aminoglycoside phosphotransferase family protein [Lachnospiraceae bacterium]